MKIRLPTILLALLLLTTPCYAGGIAPDKQKHIGVAAGMNLAVVSGNCKVADGGIATKANSGYRVVARVADNIIKVLFR